MLIFTGLHSVSDSFMLCGINKTIFKPCTSPHTDNNYCLKQEYCCFSLFTVMMNYKHEHEANEIISSTLLKCAKKAKK